MGWLHVKELWKDWKMRRTNKWKFISGAILLTAIVTIIAFFFIEEIPSPIEPDPKLPAPTTKGIHKSIKFISKNNCIEGIVSTLNNWANEHKFILRSKQSTRKIASFAIVNSSNFVEVFYELEEPPIKSELGLALVPQRNTLERVKEIESIWHTFNLDNLWNELQLKAKCDYPNAVYTLHGEIGCNDKEATLFFDKEININKIGNSAFSTKKAGKGYHDNPIFFDVSGHIGIEFDIHIKILMYSSSDYRMPFREDVFTGKLINKKASIKGDQIKRAGCSIYLKCLLQDGDT